MLMETTTLARNRERAILFIQSAEASNPSFSAYQIANHLRKFTRKSYNNNLFSWATLSKQEYSYGSLDFSVELCGETTDFSHFIASLSDQIDLPGWARFVDAATAWTSKHTSWSGDLAQAVLDYRRGKFSHMEDALKADASDADLAADLAAVRVGHLINAEHFKVSEAIQTYHEIPYYQNTRSFLRSELDADIPEDRLLNSAEVEDKVADAIAGFLAFSGFKKFGRQLKQKQFSFDRDRSDRADIDAAARYFLEYLIQKGRL